MPEDISFTDRLKALVQILPEGEELHQYYLFAIYFSVTMNFEGNSYGFWSVLSSTLEAFILFEDHNHILCSSQNLEIFGDLCTEISLKKVCFFQRMEPLSHILKAGLDGRI